MAIPWILLLIFSATNFKKRDSDFDGINDSIFHPFDKSGNKHMEYVEDHGTFTDLPWEAACRAAVELPALYADDFDFSVPAGVDFVPTNETIHFSTV